MKDFIATDLKSENAILVRLITQEETDEQVI